MRATLEFLTQEEIARIHEASLTILSQTGIRVYSEKARDMLKNHGAECDDLTVKLPIPLIEDAIKNVTSNITLASRVAKHRVQIPSKTFPYAATSGYCPFVTHYETGKRRASTGSDLRDFAIVADYLDTVGLFWPSVFPTDIPPALEEIYSLSISLRNTGKHIQCSCRNEKAAKWQIRLAECLANSGDHCFSAVVAPVSPLTFERDTCDAMITLAQAGVPVVPMTMTLAATTAPATLAGTLALANAEELAALVIVKCANPKGKMVYAAEAAPSHRRSGNIDYQAPEYPLLSAGCAQLARYYGLPNMVSDVSLEAIPVDPLSLERNVLKVAMAFMTRTDLSAFLGTVDLALSVSLSQLVLDAEAYEHAVAYLRSFDMNEETLALEIINEVAPGGSFLTKRHTAKHFRREIWNRDVTKAIILGGDPKESFLERAKATVRDILASHEPPPLDERVDHEMEQVLRRAAEDIL